jgi:iron-sulfur cluster assembly protein
VITLSDNAIKEIRRRLAETGGPAVVRLATRRGGCAGTKYVVEVGREAGPDDVVLDDGGLAVVCDRESLPSLRGLAVDWVDALMGGGWRFANPNAGSTCGCGESFRPLLGLEPR